MSEKQNILIIENQFWQFEKMWEFLSSSENYRPLPRSTSQSDFIKFIDHVRVWVNEVYSDDYRERAINFILKEIKNNNIELILMDHILGGANHCLTGIDLAFEINNKRKIEEKNIIPIVFLSITSYEDRKREKGLINDLASELKGIEEYKKEFSDTFVWIHKGYFGDDILNPTYFNEKVITSISRKIKQTEEERFWEAFDTVLDYEPPDYLRKNKDSLKGIREREYSELSDEFKKMILKAAKSEKKWAAIDPTLIK